MVLYNAANNARTKLLDSVSPGTITFWVEDGSEFPEPPFLISVGDEIAEIHHVTQEHDYWGFHAVFDPNDPAPTRGVEGTTPADHEAGAVIENRFTAGTYHEIKDFIEAITIGEGETWEVES